MYSKKLKAFWDLARPVNVLITLLAIPAASILAGATLGQWVSILLASVTGGCVAAGANSINDFFDVEIDRVNKPGRPIPRGDATKREAWIFWFLLSFGAMASNLFLNAYALCIVVSAVVILYFYSAVLKRTILAGNLVVGFMTGMAFIYGAVVAGNLQRATMPAIFAFLANVAREIIKDIEDVEGDRHDNAVTLPVRYGTKRALMAATVVILLLVAITVIAYLLKFYTLIYLYIVLIVDVLLVAVTVFMWVDQTHSTMKRISNVLKICMVIGLAAIYFGSP